MKTTAEKIAIMQACLPDFSNLEVMYRRSENPYWEEYSNVGVEPAWDWFTTDYRIQEVSPRIKTIRQERARQVLDIYKRAVTSLELEILVEAMNRQAGLCADEASQYSLDPLEVTNILNAGLDEDLPFAPDFATTVKVSYDFNQVQTLRLHSMDEEPQVGYVVLFYTNSMDTVCSRAFYYPEFQNNNKEWYNYAETAGMTFHGWLSYPKLEVLS